MKNTVIILAGLLIFAASTSFGDEAPPEHSLPNRGEGCTFKSRFEAQRITCGSARYEVWTCPVESKDSASADYLLIGIYQSDTPPHCSPTYVVKRVLRQK